MKKTFIFLFSFICLFCIVGLVFADTTTAEIKNPLGDTTDFATLLGKITDAVSALVGSIAVIMVIIAGILFATSGGNPGQVGKAKTALGYAVVGGIIALGAAAIKDTILFIMKG